MLKKIFCTAFLCATILLISNMQVSAKDVWVYTEYKGTEFYVMNETIMNKSTGHRRAFDVNVKNVWRDKSSNVVKWSFSENDGVVLYSINNGNFEPLSTDGGIGIQVGRRVWNYCLNYLGLN